MTSEEKISLSVVVITKNEEKNLPDCLKSVAWAKEIVILDDDSSDETREIAKSFTDKLFIRKMDNEGKHRNYAIQQASCEWVLSRDADERVSPQLASEIRRVLSENNPDVNGYSIPIKTFIGKRWIKGGGYYPAPKLRLFRKNKFRYDEASVHPRIFLEGKWIYLRGDIDHYGIKSFSHFIDKLNSQTTLEAQKWVTDKRKVNLPKIFRKTIDRFLRNYFLKKGYQDGFLGFIMSTFHGLYQLFTYAKYWEIKRNQQATP